MNLACTLRSFKKCLEPGIFFCGPGGFDPHLRSGGPTLGNDYTSMFILTELLTDILFLIKLYSNSDSFIWTRHKHVQSHHYFQIERDVNFNFLKHFLSTFVGDFATQHETEERQSAINDDGLITYVISFVNKTFFCLELTLPGSAGVDIEEFCHQQPLQTRSAAWGRFKVVVIDDGEWYYVENKTCCHHSNRVLISGEINLMVWNLDSKIKEFKLT